MDFREGNERKRAESQFWDSKNSELKEEVIV